MVRWTEAQLEAIEDREKNLLVSAAAGSGKTAVLVQRIIDMVLKDGIDIDKLLIVTFTNAAAGEMRERILGAFTSRLECKDIGRSERENIRRQIGLLNKSSITTIHSFCINVLRANFHFIDLDPNFRIADTTESKILIQESLEEVLEEEYGREEEAFLSLVESFTDHKGDEKLEQLIYTVYKFIQSQPYPLEWLTEQVEKFSIGRDGFLKSDWMKAVLDDMAEEFVEGIKVLEIAIERAKEDDLIDEKYGPILAEDLADIKGWQEMLDGGEVERLFEIVSKYEHPRLKSVSKEADQELKEEVQSLRGEYKDIIKGLKVGFLKKDIDSYHREINQIYPVISYLKDTVGSFSNCYRSKKMEKSIVDFNDLEHYTLELLENKDVRSGLRDRYEYIFLDEYQDSNIVQETIVESICRKNNRFLVGDVKQSIVRP